MDLWISLAHSSLHAWLILASVGRSWAAFGGPKGKNCDVVENQKKKVEKQMKNAGNLAKYRTVLCAGGSKIRGCAAAGVKVGYMGLSKVYTWLKIGQTSVPHRWKKGSTGLKMAQPGPNIGQIGGKMGPSSVWKLPIKSKLFVIASHRVNVGDFCSERKRSDDRLQPVVFKKDSVRAGVSRVAAVNTFCQTENNSPQLEIA